MMTPKEKQSEASERRKKLNNDEEFSANKVQIMTLDFLLHVAGIVPPNNATPLIRFLYKVFQTVIFTLYILALLGQMMAVYVNWGNIPVLSSTMSYTSGFLLSVILCLYFLHNKDKFTRLIDLLRNEFVAKINSKYIKFIDTAERQIRLSVTLSAPFATSLGLISIVAPFLSKSSFSNFDNNTVTTDGKKWGRLMFVIWFPFAIEESPQLEIIMVLQIILMCFAVLMLVAVDATFLLLITHAAAQFKVLCAMLNDMHENISEVELNRTKQMSPLQDTAEFNLMKDPLTSADDITCHELGSGNSASRKSETAVLENCHMNKDPFQLYLAECIKHHQAIIEFVANINEVVSLVTFVRIVNFPLILCMTGFEMTQSEKVQLAFYSTDWYSQTAGYKSLLPLAIMRASRPVTVRAGVFFDLSLLTFSLLVNASYRYFTMLIQLHDS
ncbi:uncharacterized protein LOC111871935 isoform X2 [Cryptotermes secundus]|uniref:uncharacterized protein LOC111871935 isoform X2 n=1 Tax=Cryptotermes secundus TaxID=105785 RepID=UPI000CD7B942|nr:uncharacterized protein LOC111871935 isoform X2 [Cryptotermes secundus]